MNTLGSFFSHRQVLFLWITLYGVLLGLTLNNTMPYKGDESFYIASSIQMQQSGDFLTPIYFGEFRFQKPILTYWITLAGYKFFGIHLWSGRIPFLLMACALLLLVYKFALLIHQDEDFALLSVFLLSSSTLFIEFSRASMTDLPLAFFTTLALYYFCKALENPEKLKVYYFLSFTSAGLAMSAKSFIGIFPIVAIVVYVYWKKPRPFKRYALYAFHPLYWMVMAVLGLLWYAYMYRLHPTELLTQIHRESSKHVSLSFASFFDDLLFYTQHIITFYLPFTVLAVYIYLKNRYHIPERLWLIVVYLTVMLAALVFVIGDNKSRYLLSLFPEITLLISYIIYRHKLRSLAKKIAIGWTLLQIAVFLCYPFISGAPLKDLVQYWEKEGAGELFVYGLTRRETSWLQALAHGKVRPYEGEGEFVIIMSDEVEALENYEVLHQAEKLGSIHFKDRRLLKEYQTYLLVKPSPIKNTGG